MNEKTSIRKYILEQKENKDFLPSENFIMNFEKVLNNQIEFIKNTKTSKLQNTKTVPTSRRNFLQVFFYKPAYVFALTLVLIMGITFGVVRNLPSTSTTTQDDPKNAAQVLAKVAKTVEEIKNSNNVVHYKATQETITTREELKKQTAFCERWINYTDKVQKNICGLVLEKEIPSKREITQKNILQNPEFSMDFYRNLFGFDFDTAKLISQDNNYYIIQDQKIFKNSSIPTDFNAGEILPLNIDTVNINLKVNKKTSLISEVQVSYVYQNIENIKYKYSITDPEYLASTPEMFQETKAVPTGLSVNDFTSKNLGNNKFEVTFKTKPNVKYIVLDELAYNYKLVKKIDSPLATESFIINSAPQSLYGNYVQILAYQLIDGDIIYGDSISGTFAQVDNFAKPIPLQIEFRSLDLYASESTIFNEEIIIGLSKDAAIINVNLTRVFSNSKISLKIPESWDIKEVRCSEIECTWLRLKKGIYIYSLQFNVADTRGIDDSGPTPMCSKGISDIGEINNLLQREDSYYKQEINPENSCPFVNSPKPNVYYWGGAYVVHKINPDSSPFISYAKMSNTAVPQGIDKYLDNILLSYETDLGYDPETIIASPEKDSAELKKILAEMDAMTKSIEWKK